MKKTILASLALCGALALTGCGTGAGEKAETAAADLGPVKSLVEDNGLVTHRDPYAIIPTTNGKILTCTFAEGDAVKEGDVLYTIDATALEDQITQASLSLKSAEQAYKQAADACNDLTVRAKAAGTVVKMHVHVGDFVSAGMPVAEVMDSVNLTLTVPFSPEDAARLTPGAAAVLTFPSYGGEVSGKVHRLYDAPSTLPGGRQAVFAEIRFANPGALSGGETAFARVGDIACMEAGTVANATAQALYATQSGQVLTLPIDVGSAVTRDQVIMTIDNAALTNGRENAKLARESATVSLNQLKAKREDYILRAPADGVMISRTAKAGDFAAAANPLAVLATESSLGIEVAIDEIYIEKVQPGQKAAVSFTDDSGAVHTYDAVLHRIDDAGTVSGGVTNYTVELTLDATDSLKAGMNVFVSICTGERESCLRVPSSAIADGKVQLQKDGAISEQPVTAGLTGGGYTEILSGLAEGDVVVLP